MAAVFKSNIEENGLGGWLIRLTDTVVGREELCSNMYEYSKKIEEFGADYGGDIEVQWTKADNLTPEHFVQVQQEMLKIKKELDENNQDV